MDTRAEAILITLALTLAIVMVLAVMLIGCQAPLR